MWIGIISRSEANQEVADSESENEKKLDTNDAFVTGSCGVFFFVFEKANIMNNSSKDSFEKSASQYERKLARQRQLELMEAVASGMAPSMELDTTALEDSNSSGLRSRNEATRRFLSDDDEFSAQLTKPQSLLSSPVRTSRAPATNLFDLRGRPDGLPANTGLNLMDHETGLYREQTRSERMISKLRGLFSAKTGTETFDADAAADDFVEYSSTRRTKRLNRCNVFCKSLLYDRKRRTMIMLLTCTAIVIVIVSIFSVRKAHPYEKVLRSQNNARFNAILDHIVAEGITDTAAFFNYTSPEYHALRWVAYSDPASLKVDDPMLTTRYALATFFYNSYITFEKQAGRQSPVVIGTMQWEGVPNPGWTRKDNWLTDKGVCQWYGIHCNPKRVTNPATGEQKLITQFDSNEPPLTIQIPKNHMMGALVPELKALDGLRLLDFSTNKLTGSFPTAMAHMFKLEYLHLPDNQLTGSLTSDIGFLEGLKTFDLRHNAFVGQLPTELNRLYHLELLQLSNNTFTGSIPDLAECHNLTSILLDNNRLNADFPFSLSLQLRLKEIRIDHNQIKGSIPGEILSIRGLETFTIGFNEISGVIPKAMFGRMSHLREVSFESNKITGSIPSDTSAMVQLQLLSLNGNMIKGPLPDTWGRVQTLQKLHLNQNHLTGTLPTTLGNLTSLQELWLGENSFHGRIPTQLSKCKVLESLLFEQNKLTGFVPSQLGSLTGLRTLHLQENYIHGDMPFQICNLKKKNFLSYIGADCSAKIICPKSCCSECH